MFDMNIVKLSRVYGVLLMADTLMFECIFNANVSLNILLYGCAYLSWTLLKTPHGVSPHLPKLNDYVLHHTSILIVVTYL